MPNHWNICIVFSETRLRSHHKIYLLWVDAANRLSWPSIHSTLSPPPCPRQETVWQRALGINAILLSVSLYERVISQFNRFPNLSSIPPRLKFQYTRVWYLRIIYGCSSCYICRNVGVNSIPLRFPCRAFRLLMQDGLLPHW